jgi:hypothetical protein
LRTLSVFSACHCKRAVEVEGESFALRNEKLGSTFVRTEGAHVDKCFDFWVKCSHLGQKRRLLTIELAQNSGCITMLSSNLQRSMCVYQYARMYGLVKFATIEVRIPNVCMRARPGPVRLLVIAV